MRRFSLIVSILLILVLASIAGCTGNSTAHSAKPEDPDKADIAASSTKNDVNPKTAAIIGKANSANSEQGAVVIVKSANKLSNKEKEAVLDDINNELDTLVQTINTMDDASDSDLNI